MSHVLIVPLSICQFPIMSVNLHEKDPLSFVAKKAFKSLHQSRTNHLLPSSPLVGHHTIKPQSEPLFIPIALPFIPIALPFQESCFFSYQKDFLTKEVLSAEQLSSLPVSLAQEGEQSSILFV